MNLTDSRLGLIGTSDLTDDGRVLLNCRQASELIFGGHYEEAREKLGPLWRGVGEYPALGGLSDAARGEVLLQCGALNGRFGSARRLASAQEAAKDQLSEALRIFEALGRVTKISEAKYELGVCYWRLGSLDEARLMFAEALRGLTEADSELRARILIRRTLVEISAHRYHEAWSLLKEAEPVFENAGDVLKGKWHGQRALVLLKLSNAEYGLDYADRAIIEFTAASYHHERAGHDWLCGASLNNLAFLLYKLGRHAEAHEHLDRARGIFTRLNDSGVVAQVDETRARVLVAEGRYAQAKGVIGGAVRALREAGGQALLADALVVQGIVLARLGEHEDSVATLREAMTAAEVAGAPESAGHAALTLVEEHGRGRLPTDETYEAYRRADELLARTQDSEDLARLRACARVVMERLGGVELPEGFSLPHTVLTYEARFIRQALAEESGSVARAARRLGLKHQSLSHMLQARHRQLLAARKPAVPRRRSIIRIK
ncbi:MAG TPA: tetratricopeptide repeat protein [Pyrinomonadaceae bacterium]|nr:tetratricopeptide repeat protein [Pyrinomonadaceae bacterium]